MEKERTVILKRKENIPYDFNINEEYKKYESIGDNKSELKTYKNWESHIINKCSQFTETTRLNFVHYIKGKKRSEENKIATLDAIWMPLNIFVLTVLLTFMFAFVELIKNYNAAASEIVTNYFVSNTDKLYEQTARLLEFNFKESIIFYGMFSVIILITGVALYVLGKNRRMNIANKISFYEDIILIIEKENNYKVITMTILKIICLSIGSITLLFILTKIMGQREMSQLSIFDYFITITIGSIAAELSTSLEDNFVQPVIAMIVYALITLIVSILNTKFVKLRPFLSGKTLILYDDGTLFKENFKKAKIDLNEFLVQCRTSGFFNLSDIKTALLEENGKISFLPYSDKRPANPSDFNIKPKEEEILTNLILDGKIMQENLQELGFDESWLLKKLKKQGITKTKNIFLATYCSDGNLSVYVSDNIKNS